MDPSDLSLLIRIVKKYYEAGLTQDQIAKEEFISKSTVSRLIKKATASGLVTFNFTYPIDHIQNIEGEIRQTFGIGKVVVAPTFKEDFNTRLEETCRMAAKDLMQIIEPDDILGIGRGASMEKLADIITSETLTKRKCSKVVMIEGFISSEARSSKPGGIIGKLAEFFSADGYLLPGPLICDSKEVADIIRGDSHLRKILDFTKTARICVFSIGYASHESVLYKGRAYSRNDYDELLRRGAVGDMLGYNFDINGRSVAPALDDCIISMRLDTLKQKPYRMGIAVGERKAKAIIGALRGGYVNCLYTDSLTAKEVLRLVNISV